MNQAGAFEYVNPTNNINRIASSVSHKHCTFWQKTQLARNYSYWHQDYCRSQKKTAYCYCVIPETLKPLAVDRT